jgi:hypothetical protein
MPFNAQDPIEPISRVIRELSTATKVVSFYPSGNPAVRVAVDRVHHLLALLFNRETELTLSFGEPGITHRGAYLPDSDPALRAFSSFLLNRGVARLTFRRGLDAATLTDFLRLLGNDPRALGALGGLARQLAERRISTISLEEIDLEKILASEVESIPGEGAATEEERGAWKTLLASYLLEGGMTAPAGIRALLRSLAAEPARLRDWLEHPVVATSRDLPKLMQRLAQEVSRETPESLEALAAGLAEAVLALPPRLRMDLTLLKTPVVGSAEDLMEMTIRRLPEAGVAELIGAFVRAERQLSPRLFAACARVFSVRGKTAPFFGDITAVIAAAGEDGVELGRVWQSLQGLLVESDQEYLTETAHATLEEAERGLGLDAPLRQALEADEGFDAAFAAEAISDHACRVMMGALDAEKDEERIESLRDDLERRARRMAGRERMGLLADTVRSISEPRGVDLRVPGRYGLDKRVRSVVEQMVRVFRTDFEHLSEEQKSRAGAEFKELGGIAAPALTDALAEEENWEVRRGIIAVLASMGSAAMPVLLKRLDDSSWFLVRNLALLLGEIGGQSLVEPLAGLLLHPEPRVRREAAGALGKIGGSRAVAHLRQAILDPEVSTVAARVLGEIDRANTVALFSKRLARTGRFVSDERAAREAIAILGEMEAAEAVPILSRILQRGFWMPLSAGDTLRTQAAQALYRIGTDEALGALRAGTRSARRVVRDTCNTLTSGGEPPLDPTGMSTPEAAA